MRIVVIVLTMADGRLAPQLTRARLEPEETKVRPVPKLREMQYGWNVPWAHGRVETSRLCHIEGQNRQGSPSSPVAEDFNDGVDGLAQAHTNGFLVLRGWKAVHCPRNSRKGYHMHGCMRCMNRRLAWTLALVVTCGATARGQQYAVPGAPGYAPVQGPAIQQTSAMDMAAPDDPNNQLAADVADLKKQIKDMKDKEAAAKAQAALVPSVKVSGRVQWDTDTFSQNANSIASVGDALNGSEFRRLYLAASGTMFQIFDYKAEVDLVPSHVSWKDVYIEAHNLPVAQNVLVGHNYAPFGLETETSDLNTVFMERSPLDSLGGIGSRHVGVRVSGWLMDDRCWSGFGPYATQKNENPPTFPVPNFDDNGGTAIYGRTVFLPWYDESTNGRGLWQIGMSGEYGAIPSLLASAPAGTTRYSLSSKPEANLAPVVVNTGNIADANSESALNFETLLIYGPLQIQAEYEWIRVNRTAHVSPLFDGGYFLVSYFLTGENRGYDRSRAVPGRLTPYENFFRVRTEDGNIETGKGAWEIAYRCSYLNLVNSGIQGGRLVDNTIGLNWYPTPYTKLMFDLVNSEVTSKGALQGVASLNAFLTRVQFDF
jgi:phosphate-selective porin OprO/OprP